MNEEDIWTWDSVATAVGEVVFCTNEDGALKLLSFCRDRTPTQLLAAQKPKAKCSPLPQPELGAQIAAFVAGQCRDITAAVAPEGTPFQQAVWTALRDIPYGETRSYGQLAKAVGRPGSARAVGRANGSNPIALAIPCHRVIGADGSLTGFAAGTDIKHHLLKVEGALLC